MVRSPWIVISSQMLSHCVYVWKKSNPDDADIVMYVGSSTTGVRRLSGHHALPRGQYGADDYIEFFACSTRADALELEGRLIRELQPKLNRFIPRDVDGMAPRQPLSRRQLRRLRDKLLATANYRASKHAAPPRIYLGAEKNKF